MTNEMKIALKCLAPMAHGAFGESAGNATPIRRIKVVGVNGMPRVPVLSGNSVRAVMRRLVMRDLLIDRAGLGPGLLPGAQWDRLYACLANGGHLEGEGVATIKPEDVRALREEIPPLSVFGAALYSWMLPGHMTVGFAYPRCRETLAAGLVTEAPDVAAEDLVDEVSLVRHIDREYQDPKVSGVTPMPTTVETMAIGTVLETTIRFARSATDVERGVIAYAAGQITALGAKAGAGFGVVDVSGDMDEAPYLEWLQETDDIQDRLRRLAAYLSTKKPAKPGKGA